MGENKRQKGAYYEEIAASYLAKQGLHILERNFRCRRGEIDLIAEEVGCLVFVEVKYRKDGKTGCSLEAVDLKKQQRIGYAAKHYLAFHRGTFDVPCRFDVVGIDGEKISWVRNAFEFYG